jgi:hypothetical protein
MNWEKTGFGNLNTRFFDTIRVKLPGNLKAGKIREKALEKKPEFLVPGGEYCVNKHRRGDVDRRHKQT